MAEIKLKPCPFCGAQVSIDDISTRYESYYMVQCENKKCNAAACFGDESETQEGAARAWNRRCSETTVNQYGNTNTNINNVGTMNLRMEG